MQKSVPKTKEGVNTFNQRSERKPDSMIPCRSTTKVKQKLFIEAINKITIQRVVLGIILCTLTVGISVPVGLFVVKVLLREDDFFAA